MNAKRGERPVKTFKNVHAIMVVAFVGLLCFLLPLTTRSQQLATAPNLIPGQSATRLADGRLLILGGESASGGVDTASIWDARTNGTTQLSARLNQGRAWHTATVLPDGLVLILGGIGNNGQVVATAELFDPATQTFVSQPATGVTARARHSATLLTDGHVLIVGGVGANGQTLLSAELWDALHPSAINIAPTTTRRRGHSATLLADGRVLLWGGSDGAGAPLNNGEIYDPANKRFTAVQSFPTALLPQSTDAPALAASIPVDRDIDVDTDTMIALRFSKPLRVETVNDKTISLSGPKGIEKISVVPAENGSLAFLTPEATLLPGATYTVSINGAIDRDGLLVPVAGLNFSTKRLGGTGPTAPPPPGGLVKPLPQTPPSTPFSSDDDLAWKGKLRNGKPHSDWQDLPPLQALAGVTALAGQVLDLKGDPLANVKLEIEGGYGHAAVSSQTDATGRFLITNIEPGRREIIIDGRVARRRVSSRSASLGPREDHGIFEYGHDIKGGETNVLQFTIWLPKIDHAHRVSIPKRLTKDIVITSPKIPGLEFHLPANAEIVDHEGKPVRAVGLTRIPLDRPPFPFPVDVRVPVYFTAQPGGAYVYNPGGKGARVYYPNYLKELPGARISFWHYDPGYEGWYRYGAGTVPPDGKQIVPDPGVSVYEFNGAMAGNQGAGGNPVPPPPECKEKDKTKCKPGDPVDAATGLFMTEKSDLYLPDSIMPIDFKRSYRPGDVLSRAFGIGGSHAYDMFLTGTVSPYSFMDLNLPDGQQYRFNRISAGTGNTDGVYEHISSRTRWYKGRISWNGTGWNLQLTDGSSMSFLGGIGATRPGQSGVITIRDTNGNATSITRDSAGNATRIIAPGGRFISLTYDASNRITQAQDNIGRIVAYLYDASGRLTRVTDPNGGTNEFTYDASNRMLTMKDARGIVFITNQYDATGKVIQQTMVDGGVYQFSYTMSGSTVVQTDVTDPRGMVSRRTFNANGYLTSYTNAVGRPEEQVTTYNLEAGTGRLLSETDALNRTTSYTYDAMGNVTSVTRMLGTPEAVTTTATYEPVFNRLTSVTDPLNHTTTFGYDAKGNLVTVTNALNQTTTITRNAAGQATAITDALNNTTQFTYDFGDHAATTDPLGNATTRFTDSAGRVLGVTDPLGSISIYDYDVLNRLTKVTDPISGQTSFSYDPNGNLLSVTDARSNATLYTYDNMDRLATRQDPMLRTETHQYDLNGNRSQFTDRKSQVATYTYDGLDRRTGVTYADTSTTGFTFDKGNRLTQVNDSIAGTITRTYDGLNRLTSETTPQGSVSYTYDAKGRRSSMTVAGQTAVNYSYDNANRLTQITQGSSTVTYAYDAAGRRTSLTLPNNVLVEYAYDSASRLTAITYKQNGTTVLGNLTYEYDKNGNRTKTGGSFARTGVPPAVASTAYNAANHQTTFDNKNLTYDNNGNLQTITDPTGTTTYTWNARNQLTGISGPGTSASFVYDGLGRREKKTINGSLTEFLYDGLNPVQETSGATILANILPGLGIDEFLTRTDVVAGVTSHFLTDVLGSPVAVTDNAGVVQTEYTYEPFGKTTFSGASNSSSYQYTGRENDGTGLFYYRNRYYHPQLQRFISEDPIEFGGGGFNLYPYVGNNPLRYLDPFGLCFGKNCDMPPGSNKSNLPKPIPPDPCVTMDCNPPRNPPPCSPANPCPEGPAEEPKKDDDGWPKKVKDTCGLLSAVLCALGTPDLGCDVFAAICESMGNNPQRKKGP